MAPTIPVTAMTSTHTANERKTKTIHSSGLNAGTSLEPPFGGVSYVTDLPL